jgi:hypothetical protein
VPATEPGHYPALAYQLAFAVMVALQVCAWGWCLITPRKLRATATVAEPGQ